MSARVCGRVGLGRNILHVLGTRFLSVESQCVLFPVPLVSKQISADLRTWTIWRCVRLQQIKSVCRFVHLSHFQRVMNLGLGECWGNALSSSGCEDTRPVRPVFISSTGYCILLARSEIITGITVSVRPSAVKTCNFIWNVFLLGIRVNRLKAQWLLYVPSGLTFRNSPLYPQNIRR
jgi:hypothetical protein